jgi:YkoP domain
MALWESNGPADHSPYSHPWLAQVLFAFDRRLRRQQAVVEYSVDRSCIFRVQICPCRRNLVLGDGTRLRAGERIARLHYWNEHMPSTRKFATKIGWARDFHRCIAVSLGELARYLRRRGDLADVNIVCADVTSAVSERSEAVAHIMRHYGFETIYDSGPLPFRERLVRLGENILISLMVFVLNPDSLRPDTLRRTRVPIYVSRRELERRFGETREATLNAAEP